MGRPLLCVLMKVLMLLSSRQLHRHLRAFAEGVLDGDDAFQQIHDPQHQCHVEAAAGISEFGSVRQVIVERSKKERK